MRYTALSVLALAAAASVPTTSYALAIPLVTKSSHSLIREEMDTSGEAKSGLESPNSLPEVAADAPGDGGGGGMEDGGNRLVGGFLLGSPRDEAVWVRGCEDLRRDRVLVSAAFRLLPGPSMFSASSRCCWWCRARATGAWEALHRLNSVEIQWRSNRWRTESRISRWEWSKVESKCRTRGLGRKSRS